jgi:hypothetical protein
MRLLFISFTIATVALGFALGAELDREIAREANDIARDSLQLQIIALKWQFAEDDIEFDTWDTDDGA